MINRLNGVISPVDLEMVRVASSLRFQNPEAFYAPEALILYEQGVLPEERITEMYNQEIGEATYTPQLEYISPDIIKAFSGKNCVPFKYDNIREVIHVGVLPEFKTEFIPPYQNKEVEKTVVPIHWYVKNYTKHYTRPNFILDLPPKVLFNFIVDEATALGAADITISQNATSSKVYYNVRKKMVPSKRSITKREVDPIINYALGSAGATIAINYTKPISFSLELNQYYRGRAELVRTYQGLSLTIRLLPNDLFKTSLEELNIKDKSREFLRRVVMAPDNGLRIFVGPTYSGKNTTIASILREIAGDYGKKGVSVEQPVELIMDFMEQIDTRTEEEYIANIASLLRQNPDIIYVTEMTDYTAKSIMNVANTGKTVYTSIHANNLADVISRIQDLTGYSTDRIVQNLHTLVYQELIRNDLEDKVYPKIRCMHFSKELKSKLYGKSTGEIITLLSEVEEQWRE